MKTKFFLTTTLALATAATLVVAQDGRPQRPQGGRPQGSQQGGGPGTQGSNGRSQGGGQRGGGQGMQRPPTIPIVEALDVNKDHVIDAQEIANAVAALKKLDKNGDGKLTHDEFMPKRPDGAGAPPDQGGAGGPPPQQ